MRPSDRQVALSGLECGALVAGLLGNTYTSSQMTYDLRRLRRKRADRRRPRSNTYVLTPGGVRVAIFYTKVYGRLLRPLLAVDHPPAGSELRQALRVIDTHVVASIVVPVFPKQHERGPAVCDGLSLGSSWGCMQVGLVLPGEWGGTTVRVAGGVHNGRQGLAHRVERPAHRYQRATCARARLPTRTRVHALVHVLAVAGQAAGDSPAAADAEMARLRT